MELAFEDAAGGTEVVAEGQERVDVVCVLDD